MTYVKRKNLIDTGEIDDQGYRIKVDSETSCRVCDMCLRVDDDLDMGLCYTCFRGQYDDSWHDDHR